LLSTNESSTLSRPQFTSRVNVQTQGEKMYFEDCSYLIWM